LGFSVEKQILVGKQIVPRAPWVIPLEELGKEEVRLAVEEIRSGKSPTDVPIPTPNMTRSRTPPQRGHHTPLGQGQILQMLSYGSPMP